MSQRRIDIVTLVNRVIEKTDENECKWAATSTNAKYKLSLPSGSISVEFVETSNWGEDYYKLEVADMSDFIYATFIGDNENNDYYQLFQRLYKAIIDYFTRIQEEKFARLFDDLK